MDSFVVKVRQHVSDRKQPLPTLRNDDTHVWDGVRGFETRSYASDHMPGPHDACGSRAR